MDPVFRAAGISRTYGEGEVQVQALRDVDLAIVAKLGERLRDEIVIGFGHAGVGQQAAAVARGDEHAVAARAGEYLDPHGVDFLVRSWTGRAMRTASRRQAWASMTPNPASFCQA